MTCLSDLVLGILEIINHKDFNKNNFFKFTKIIGNVNNLKNLQDFFIKINEIFNNLEKEKFKKKFPQINFSIKNVKIFFSYYTLLYYPDIMNIDSKSKTVINLINKGNSMRIYFLILLNYIKNNKELDNIKLLLKTKEFLYSYNDFINLFNEWKGIDRECLIYNLTQNWYRLDNDSKDSKNISNTELSNLTKENVDSEKIKIIEKILLLDKDRGEEKFNYYYDLLLEQKEFELSQNNFFDKLVDSLHKNMKKSFWDLMKKDLLKEPIQTLSLSNNLKELKNIIVCCVNKKTEQRVELDKVIDIELIEQMIIHNAYNYQDLANIIKYVISLLWKYQAPIEDKKTENYENEIMLKIEKKENIIDILVFFLSFVMEKFENILLIKYSILENKK